MSYLKARLANLKELTMLDAILCTLAFSLLFSISCNLHLLALYRLLFDNADVLFIEDVARNLNSGGNLTDWRLTQAPYLFPDIFLARIIALFTPKIGQVGVIYQSVFGIIVLSLIMWLTNLSKVKSLLPVVFAGVIYSLSYFGTSLHDGITVYFGLIGHHNGIVICILLAFCATLIFLEKKEYEFLATLTLFFSVFFGVISDASIILILMPLFISFSALLYQYQDEPLAQLRKLWGILILALIVGKGFTYTVPFPQDRRFMHIVMRHFPHKAGHALNQFVMDFKYYLLHNPISALIFILYLAACGFALHQLILIVRHQKIGNRASTLLSLFILLIPATFISTQILLGLYESIASSRQWAPIVYLSIVFGFLIAVKSFPAYRHYQKIFVALLTFLLLVGLTLVLRFQKNTLPTANEIKKVAACMQKNHLPEGAVYVADYWVARPLRMFSHERYGVLPFTDKFKTLANAANVVKARRAHPRFIITGYDLNYEEVIKTFGPPQGIYCEHNAFNLKVLDYRSNQEAMAYLRHEAIQTS